MGAPGESGANAIAVSTSRVHWLSDFFGDAAELMSPVLRRARQRTARGFDAALGPSSDGRARLLSQALDGVDDIGANEPAVPAELDARQHAAPGVVAHGRTGDVQQRGDLLGGQQLVELAGRESRFGALGGVQPLRVHGHDDVLSSSPVGRPPGTRAGISSDAGLAWTP